MATVNWKLSVYSSNIFILTREPLFLQGENYWKSVAREELLMITTCQKKAMAKNASQRDDDDTQVVL